MRLKDKTENLDYCETKRFFGKRANKYNENNPYAVTMYQDNNAELVKQRNTKEIEKLYPMLKIDQKFKNIGFSVWNRKMGRRCSGGNNRVLWC